MDIWLFVKAILKRWWVLMGSAIFTLLGFFVKPEYALRISYVLAALLFMLAAYLAWRDKHHELRNLKERLSSPRFEVKITSFFSKTDDRSQTIVAVIGHIVNPHGPPSGTLDWLMSIEFGDGRVIRGIALLSLDDFVPPVSPGEPQLNWRRSEYWPDKTVNPIQPGAVASGWYWSVFPRTTQYEIYTNRGTAVVQFTDAVGGGRHVGRCDISRAGLYVVPNWT